MSCMIAASGVGHTCKPVKCFHFTGGVDLGAGLQNVSAQDRFRFVASKDRRSQYGCLVFIVGYIDLLDPNTHRILENPSYQQKINSLQQINPTKRNCCAQ